MATSGDSEDKICFSIITEPLNPIGCLFEKILSRKTLLIQKRIWLSNKVKCTVLKKTIIAKFAVIENFLICQGSKLGGNQITNEVFSPWKSYKIRIWSTNVQIQCTWKPWNFSGIFSFLIFSFLRNFQATDTFYATFHRGTAFTFAPGFVANSIIHAICGYIIATGQITHRIPAISNWNFCFFQF